MLTENKDASLTQIISFTYDGKINQLITKTLANVLALTFDISLKTQVKCAHLKTFCLKNRDNNHTLAHFPQSTVY